VDAAPPHSADLELSGVDIEELWREADAGSAGLSKDELATALLTVGVKCNYGLAPGIAATRHQIIAFWRSLQLHDLALAQACALGRDAAWQQFMVRYRETLTQAAIGITGSVAIGRELADSLYAELFGLTERGQQRRSPLAYYSGRGSLKGFLRATLAQRNVDRHRRASREEPLPTEDLAAASPAPIPASDVLLRLGRSLTAVLSSLAPEERFLLSAWFLDRRTLLEISRILGVHEATASRRLQRLTASLHKALLANLLASGLSRAAAEEALGADPRDLEINLRALLQCSQPAAFLHQGASADPEQK
jgi:RNA polymerase sigma-70 factor (ECF subfamily)